MASTTFRGFRFSARSELGPGCGPGTGDDAQRREDDERSENSQTDGETAHATSRVSEERSQRQWVSRLICRVVKTY